MRSFPKIMFSLAAMTLAVGLALGVTGTFMGGKAQQSGWHFAGDFGSNDGSREATASEPQTVVATEDTGTGRVESVVVTDQVAAVEGGEMAVQSDIRKLDIEIGGAQLVIVEGDTFALEVSGTDNYQNKMKDGVWKVQHAEMSGSNVRFDMTIPAGYVFEEVDIECGAGVVSFDGLSTAELDVEAGAGKISFSELNVTRKSDFEVGMGTLDVEGGSLQGKVNISCGMGAASFLVDIPDDFGYIVECGAGSVKLNDKSFSGLGVDESHNKNAATVYDIECAMGSVKVIDG